MNKEVKIILKVEGVDKEIKTVDDLTSAVKSLGTENKKTAESTSFFGEKLKGVKSFFSGLKKDAKGLQNDFAGFAKGLGLSAKASKGLAVGLSALGIPILLAGIAAAIEFFKNFEQGMIIIEKITNIFNAAIGKLTESLVSLFSGDFKGFINGLLGIGDAVQQASKDTDTLFESSRKLAEEQERNTVANAELNKELKLAQKTLEDGTASYEDRVEALRQIEEAQTKLLENQQAELILQKQNLEAQLRLENNFKDQLKIKQQLADLESQRLGLETELAVKAGQANKKIRELDIQRTKEAQEQAKKRAEIEQKFQDNKVKLLQEIQLLEIKDIREKEAKKLEFDLQNALDDLNRTEFNETKKGELRLQIQNKYKILEEQLNDKFIQESEIKEQIRQDAENKIIEDNLNKLNQILAKNDLDSIENLFRKSEIQIDIEEQKQLEIARLAGATEDQILAITNNSTNKRKKLAQDELDFKKALKEAEVESALQATSQVLGSIVSLVGEGTAVGKAAAVAQTTIDTYSSATAAYKSVVGAPIVGPTLAPIAAGVAIAAGLLNVKKILAVKTPGGKGVSAPSISAPSATPFDPRESLAGTNLGAGNPTDILADQQMTVKAFVVSSDMTSQQEKDRKQENISRL